MKTRQPSNTSSLEKNNIHKTTQHKAWHCKTSHGLTSQHQTRWHKTWQHTIRQHVWQYNTWLDNTRQHKTMDRHGWDTAQKQTQDNAIHTKTTRETCQPQILSLVSWCRLMNIRHIDIYTRLRFIMARRHCFSAHHLPFIPPSASFCYTFVDIFFKLSLFLETFASLLLHKRCMFLLQSVFFHSCIPF